MTMECQILSYVLCNTANNRQTKTCNSAYTKYLKTIFYDNILLVNNKCTIIYLACFSSTESIISVNLIDSLLRY